MPDLASNRSHTFKGASPLEKTARVRSYYADLAENVDDLRFVFMNHGYANEGADGGKLSDDDQAWRYSINLVRRVTEGVQLDGKRILDVGCGRGGACFYLRQHFQPQFVTGIDCCFEGLRCAARQDLGSNLSFVCGNACELPICDRSIDVVINIESSHCYEDLVKFYREIDRVLVPGGMFCYADSFMKTAIQHINQILATMPFRLIRMVDITPGVMRAIDSNRDRYSSLLNTMKTSEPRNKAAIEQLIEAINTHAYNGYKSGQLAFFHWLLRKL